MEENNIQKREDILFERISRLIDESHRRIKTTVNTAMVYTYYSVGKYIVEDELQGERRATYGKSVMKDLSIRLTLRYGKGWSLANLKNAKQFYLLYMERLNTVYPIQTGKVKHCLANLADSTQQIEPDKDNLVHGVDQINPFALSWSHYLVLMRIKNDDGRRFYEIESRKQDWSVRQLLKCFRDALLRHGLVDCDTVYT